MLRQDTPHVLAAFQRCTYIDSYIQGEAMQVAKWGNSLAVRLPAAVVEALELKEGLP